MEREGRSYGEGGVWSVRGKDVVMERGRGYGEGGAWLWRGRGVVMERDGRGQ